MVGPSSRIGVGQTITDHRIFPNRHEGSVRNFAGIFLSRGGGAVAAISDYAL